MCYEGKCFFCIPLEKGCLVLAILSAITNGIVLLGCISMGFVMVLGLLRAESIDDPELRDMSVDYLSFVGMTVGAVIAIIGVASFFAFTFSVLLCNGICKRRPGQIRAYFIYGVVVSVLTFLAATLQMTLDNKPAPGIMAMVGCLIYCLFLVLVRKTYAKVCAGAVKEGHVRLVDCAYSEQKWQIK